MHLPWKNIHIAFLLCAVALKTMKSVEMDDFLIEYMKFNESLNALSAKISDMENTIVSLTNRLEENWGQYERVTGRPQFSFGKNLQT